MPKHPRTSGPKCKKARARKHDNIVLPTTTGGEVLSPSELIRFLYKQKHQNPKISLNSLFLRLKSQVLVQVVRHTLTARYNAFMDSLKEKMPNDIFDELVFEQELKAVKDWDKKGRDRIIVDDAHIQRFVKQNDGLQKVEFQRKLTDLLNNTKAKEDKKRLENGSKKNCMLVPKSVHVKTVYNYLRLAKQLPKLQE